MNITLGSLLSEDLRALQELDLLPDDASLEASGRNEQVTPSSVKQNDSGSVQALVQQENQPHRRTQQSGRAGSLTWFEEMLDGSRLGRIQKTRRGIGVSNDGSTKVEWEVSEYFDDGAEAPLAPSSSKRKIGDVARDEDVSMQH